MRPIGCPPEGNIAEDVRRQVAAALHGHFRPEFLNRVDEIIFFHVLGRSHLTSIVDIQLRQLSTRLGDRKVGLTLTTAAKTLLVDEGFDPTFGARPLKRTIQRRVLDPLAMRILQGECGEGDQVVVDAREGELTFVKQTAATA